MSIISNFRKSFFLRHRFLISGSEIKQLYSSDIIMLNQFEK